MKRLIIDSGVWYAAFDQRDDKYVYSDKILNLLEMHELIVPFPSLYETINTRLLRNKYKQADYLFEYLNDSKKVILVEKPCVRDPRSPSAVDPRKQV